MPSHRKGNLNWVSQMSGIWIEFLIVLLAVSGFVFFSRGEAVILLLIVFSICLFRQHSTLDISRLCC